MNKVSKNVEVNQFSMKIGYAIILMMQNNKYSLFHIATIKYWTAQAILLDQIEFYFDASGSPIGYFTWAFLACDVEKRLLHDNNTFFLHPSEWNEGESIWILDICFPKGVSLNLKNEIIKKFSQSHHNIKWLGRKKNISRRRVFEISF
ncbi:MAG: toxin-activating lysine-acyltransferase [Burkholderiales bacterium]|nr:toxin-activating lysine-acyltransferase [Burkholderiales bacterium]